MKIQITEKQMTRLMELMDNDKVICDSCGWSWGISDGGDDPYICHKCGHDNTEDK